MKQLFFIYRFARIFTGPLLWGIFFALCGPAILLFSRWTGMVPEELANSIGTNSQILSWLVFLLLVFRKWEKRSETARAFDERFHAGNRFETLLELVGSGHILKERQYHETQDFYKGRRLPFPFYLSLILPLIFVAVNGFMLCPAGTKKAEEEIRESVSPVIVSDDVSADDVRLVLLQPEKDADARSIDVIHWDGAGESAAGFTQVRMNVYVNGELVRENVPEGDEPKAGKNRFSGKVSLDMLSVKPYDIVTLRLHGIFPVETGGKVLHEAYSDARFIRIQPFEPKRRNPQVLTSEQKTVKEALGKIAAAQMNLNRDAIASAFQKPNTETDKELSARQEKIAAETESLITSANAAKIPAGALNEMKRAHIEMQEAAKESDRQTALTAQVRVLDHLSSSLKRVAPETDSLSSAQDALDKALSSQNLDVDDLISEVDNLLTELRPESADGTMPEEKSEFRPAVISDTENAYDKAVREGKKNQEKQQVRIQSDKNTAAALKQAQESISTLTENMQKPDFTPKQAEDEMIAIASGLARAAEKEQREGIRQNAELLAETASAIFEESVQHSLRDNNEDGSKTAEQLKRIVDEAAQPQASARIRLEKIGTALEDIREKERRGDWRKAQEIAQEKKETLLQAKDTLENLSGENPEKNAVLRAVNNSLEDQKSSKQTDQARLRISEFADKLAETEPGMKSETPVAPQPPVMREEDNQSLQLSEVKKEQRELAEKLENRQIQLNDAVKEQEKIRLKLDAAGGKKEISDAMKGNSAALASGKMMPVMENAEKIDTALQKQLDEIHERSDDRTAKALQTAEKQVSELKGNADSEKSLQSIAEDLYKAAEQENISGTRSNAELLSSAADMFKEPLENPDSGDALEKLEQGLKDAQRPEESIRRTLTESLKEIKEKRESLLSRDQNVKAPAVKEMQNVLKVAEDTLAPVESKAAQDTVRSLRNAAENPDAAKQLDAAVNRMEELVEDFEEEVSGYTPEEKEPIPQEMKMGGADWKPYVPPSAETDNPHLQLTTLADRQAQLNAEVEEKRVNNHTAAVLQSELMNQTNYTPAMPPTTEQLMKNAGDQYHRNQPDAGRQQGIQAEKQLREAADRIRNESNVRTMEAITSAENIFNGGYDKETLGKVAESLSTAAETEQKKGTSENAAMLSGIAQDIHQKAKDNDLMTAAEETHAMLSGVRAGGGNSAPSRALAGYVSELKEKQADLQRFENQRQGSTEKQMAVVGTETLLRHAEMAVDQFSGLPPDVAREMQSAKRALSNARENPASLKQLDTAVQRLDQLAEHVQHLSSREESANTDSGSERLNPGGNAYSRLTSLERRQRDVAESARTRPAGELKKVQDTLNRELQEVSEMPYFAGNKDFENILKDSKKDMAAVADSLQKNQGGSAQSPAYQAANRLNAMAEKIRQNSDRATSAVTAEISQRLQNVERNLNNGIDQKKNLEKLAADVENAAKKEFESGTLENAEFLTETAAAIRAVIGPDEQGAFLNRGEQKASVAELRKTLAVSRHNHEASAAALKQEMQDLTAANISREEQQRRLARTGDIINRIETRDQNVRRRIDEAGKAIRTAMTHTDSPKAVETALRKIDALTSELAPGGVKKETENAKAKNTEFHKPVFAPEDNAYSRLTALEREQRKLSEKTANPEISLKEIEKPQKELSNRLNWTRNLELMRINNTEQRIRGILDTMRAVREAINRNDRNNASGFQNRVADELRNMAEDIRQNSNRTTAEKLNRIAQQVEQTRAKSGQEPQKETRAKLEELAQQAAVEARREYQTGTQQNAELLADIAEKLHQTAKSKNLSESLETLKKDVEQARKPHAAAEKALKEAFETLNSGLAEKKPDEKLRALHAAGDAIAELNSDRNQPALVRDRLNKANQAVRTALEDQKNAIKTAAVLKELDGLLTEIKPSEQKASEGDKNKSKSEEKPEQPFELPNIKVRENNPFTRFLRLEQNLREFSVLARDGAKTQEEKLQAIRKDLMELYKLKDLPEHQIPNRMNILREIERNLEQGFTFARENRMNEATAFAQRAADGIRQVAWQIRQESNRSASEALNQFDRTLKEAATALKEKRETPEHIRKKMNESAEKMERSAAKEHRSGTQENAEMLADLATKLKNDVRAIPSGKEEAEQLTKAIAENLEKVAAARNENAARVRYLEKTLADLERTLEEKKQQGKADIARGKMKALMNEASDILKNTESRDNTARQSVEQTLNEIKDADEAAVKGQVQRPGQPPKDADTAAKEVLRKLDKTITELKPGMNVPHVKTRDFRDAELATGSNAYRALLKLQRAQMLLNDSLEKGKIDSNTVARQQEQLIEMLKKLQTSSVFQAQDRKNDLSETIRKMTDSLNLIRSGKPQDAAVQGKLALTPMDRMLSKIRQESDRKVKANLDEADRAVQSAIQQRKSGQQTPEKTLEALDFIADKLARSAEQENVSGTQSGAELLAKTARGIHEAVLAVKAGKALDDKLLEQVAETIAEAKKENAAAATALEKSLQQLMHVKNNTMKKTDPKTGKPGETLVKDSGANQEEAKNLSEQLKKEKEEALNAIGEALKTIPPKKQTGAAAIGHDPADDWDAELELPEFKGVSVTVGNNALLHLDAIIKQQQELNKEIRSGKETEKTAAKQEALREALDKAEEILNQVTGQGNPMLEEVSEKMKSAAVMLKNGKPDVAAERGELAVAGLKRLARELQKRSDANTEKQIDKTIHNLHEASENLRNNRTGSGRTLKMMAGEMAELAKVAEFEGKAGSLRNSEALANAAKQLHDSIRSLRRAGVPEERQRAELADILDGLARSLTGAKNMSSNPVPFLEKTLEELTETQKYLDYLSRNPDAGEERATEREAAFLLQKLAGALNGIGRGGSAVTGNMSTEKLLRSVDEALKHPGSEAALSPVIDQLDKFVTVMKISVRSHVFQADEIPEKYHEDARRYFERLSQQEEGKK